MEQRERHPRRVPLMKDFTIDGFVAQNVETKAAQSGRMVTKF